MKTAQPESLVVLFTEKVQESLDLVQHLKDKEIVRDCEVAAEEIGLAVGTN